MNDRLVVMMEKIRLGDAFSFIRNGANIKQGVKDGGYPITRIETISDRAVNREKMGYAGITDIGKYNDYILKDGDILMSHINSEKHLGKAAIYKKKNDEKIIHGMNLLCLRPDKDVVLPEYAFYFLSSVTFLRQIPNITKKSVNQASFTVTALKELVFPKHGMDKQKKVIKQLDKITDLIDKRKKQLEKLDELVKSRFIEMFGDSEFNTMQWPTKKLSEICAVSSSKRIYQNELSTEGVPFLRISDLNERIDNAKNVPELFIPINKYNELKENGLVPTEGDILVTSRGTLGRCYIVRPEDEFYFQDGMISWLSDLNSQITSVYLSQLFAMSGIQKQIASLQAGSTVAYLSITMLKKLNIMLPPLDRQEQFAAFVKQTDKSKFEIKQSLEKLELLKKALMQKYFG